MVEGILAFQHLGLAGLIPGSYPVPSSTDIQIGINVPASKFGNGNVGYHYTDAGYVGSGWNFAGLQIGAYNPGDRPVVAMMTAVDAANIDTKMDDGKANSGLVLGDQWEYTPQGGGWADHCTDGAGNYLVSTPGIICRLVWFNQIGWNG